MLAYQFDYQVITIRVVNGRQFAYPRGDAPVRWRRIQTKEFPDNEHRNSEEDEGTG